MENGNKKKKKMGKTVKEYLDRCEDIRQKINHIRDDTHDVNDILLNKQFYRLEGKNLLFLFSVSNYYIIEYMSF